MEGIKQQVALLKEQLKDFMFNEHSKVHSDSYRQVPVLVEDTELGNDIEVLLGVISGKRRVEAYNYVSFRVLHRLANLMSGKPWLQSINYLDKSDEFEGENREASDNVPQVLSFNLTSQNAADELEAELANMIDEAKFIMKRKKHFELKLWAPFKKIEDKEPDEFERIPLKVKYYGELMQHIYEECKNEIDHSYESSESMVCTSKIRDELNKLYQAFKDLKSNPAESASQSHLPDSKQKILLTKMQNFEIVQEKGTDRKQASKPDGLGEKIERSFGFSNLQLRGLCITTYLRCLSALVLNDDISDSIRQDQSVSSIVKQQIKADVDKLTRLCSTTGWFEAGVGRRYLKIMFNVLAFGPTHYYVHQKDISCYEVVANVASTILVRLRDKI